MKFKQSEHDVFKELILDSGLDYSAFLFTKKKGWLHIGCGLADKPFLFHRKSTTQLDHEGAWVKSNFYLTQENGVKMEYTSFDEIKALFLEWLNQLQS